ncbi:hypothetical protein ACFL1U_02690 [Patescibacteria group bacterium]
MANNLPVTSAASRGLWTMATILAVATVVAFVMIIVEWNRIGDASTAISGNDIEISDLETTVATNVPSSVEFFEDTALITHSLQFGDDTIELESPGSVDWTVLQEYPEACVDGSAITAVGDDLVCTPFYDELGDIPIGPVAPGSSNLSTGGQIYTWVISRGYITDDTYVPKNHLANDGTLSFDWVDSEISNSLTLDSTSTVDSTALIDGGTIGFDWVDAEVADILTISVGSTVDSTTLIDGGTIGFEWVDAEVSDAISISSLGSVDSTSLWDGGTIAFDWTDEEVEDALTISAAGSVDSLALIDGGTIAFDWTDAEVEDALTISAAGSVNSLALIDGGTISFEWIDAEVANILTVGVGSTVDSTTLTDGGTISFDWVDDEVADDLTISSAGSVDSTALTDGGTIAFEWVDAEVADALTISSAGSVDWTALTNYPGACPAGEAVTQIGDTLVCTAFWDAIGDVPTATPSSGDAANLSTAGDIYAWVTGLGYITDDTSVPKGDLANSGILVFDWVDGEVADTISISSLGSVDSLALVDGGTIGFVWVDAEIDDAITISATGSVAWTALTGYPAACPAGEAIQAIGDTITCIPVGGSGSIPTFKSYSMASAGVGAGQFYMAGFYEAPTADANLTQASSTVTHGSANHSYASKAFIVTGAAGTTTGPGTGPVEIEVSGTSITDAGVRTASDTEIILADTTTASTNAYYQTTKKWIGTVTYTIQNAVGSTQVNYSLDFNYGFARYEDIGQNDFTLGCIEAVGLAGANDTNFNVQLFYHSSAGWTYSAAAFVPGGTELANMQTIQAPEDNLVTGEHFSFKKFPIGQAVNASSGDEGYVIKVTLGTAGSIDYMDIHIGMVP